MYTCELIVKGLYICGYYNLGLRWLLIRFVFQCGNPNLSLFSEKPKALDHPKFEEIKGLKSLNETISGHQWAHLVGVMVRQMKSWGRNKELKHVLFSWNDAFTCKRILTCSSVGLAIANLHSTWNKRQDDFDHSWRCWEIKWVNLKQLIPLNIIEHPRFSDRESKFR